MEECYMGSNCKAEFINKGKNHLSGFYSEEILNGSGKDVKFSVAPGKILQITIGFGGFNYYSFSINEESDKGKANYFEIRSIADFLLLQQVLEKRYNLELIKARPDYRDFW